MPIREIIEKSIFNGGISIPLLRNKILKADETGSIIGIDEITDKSNYRESELKIINRMNIIFKIFDSLEVYIYEGIFAILLEVYCAMKVLENL
jgi:hypothetical protein